MRLHILAIGKPRLAYAKSGIEEYVARLSPRGGVEIVSLKSGTREQESEALLARSEGMFRVVLDERGDQISSRAFAQKLAQWELQRTKSVAFSDKRISPFRKNSRANVKRFPVHNPTLSESLFHRAPSRSSSSASVRSARASAIHD